MSAVDRIMHQIELSAMVALRQIGKISQDRIVESLSVEGSPKPFIAAPAGMPSTNWYDSMIDAIKFSVDKDGDNIVLTVASVAEDEYVNKGYHFSEDAERGGVDWDGRAFVPETGLIEQVTKPHRTSPHPFMGPEVERLQGDAARLLVDNWFRIA